MDLDKIIRTGKIEGLVKKQEEIKQEFSSELGSNEVPMCYTRVYLELALSGLREYHKKILEQQNK